MNGIYIYTMEYYTDTKKNEILPFATTWMNLEVLCLVNYVNKKERQILFVIPYMWNIKNKVNE